MSADPQLAASRPGLNVALRANAGSGKTWTLVARVARLLLAGARPDAILCVTYTKAAAAEMERRLFEWLGDWSVLDDAALEQRLAALDEPDHDLSDARALFARALETPGGLKIQTIHAFCEKLLKRFPVEAAVSPGFTVLEDAAAANVSERARDLLAEAALADPDGPIGHAYAHLSVEVDARGFEAMLKGFEARRRALSDWFGSFADMDAMAAEVWARCGFPDGPAEEAEIEAEALAAVDPGVWRAAADLLARGSAKRDQAAAEAMASAAAGEATLESALAIFVTQKGEPLKWWDEAKALQPDPALHAAVLAGRDALLEGAARLKAAAMARDTAAALTLASVQIGLYGREKARSGALDFDDLIERTWTLLTKRADAAWVLYKLDYGIDHILLDEAQDTAPAQWDILAALSDEFMAGTGLRAEPRTVFLVGDEKQSIYSFQGAAPERLIEESRALARRSEGAGAAFRAIDLLTSRRSRPEILAFVDAVCAQPQVLAGLRPGEGAQDDIVHHEAFREAGGCVDLWPLEEGDAAPETDPWEPVDADPPESANKRLARRIAAEIKALIERGDAVGDGENRRPANAGDVLVLVRRRKLLFEEIIRALKQEGVPVAGADRLKLSGHIAFLDLVALARFCLFPDDDLTLAALLRSPFCGVDEESLFDLAHSREGALWAALSKRGDERAEWGQARAFLGWAKGEAHRTPFDFYGRVLSRLDAEGRSMRLRILGRLGAEARDVIDEFIAQTLALEHAGARDLETFVAAVADQDLEIKREQDEGRGEVRVMTVHGAKGLEAPIVFLPDTTARAEPGRDPLLALEDGGFLWAPRAADDCEASAAARAARERRTDEETQRLLYVAMTRARDRLVIAGAAKANRKTGMDTGCWYETLEQAFGGAREIKAGEFAFQRLGPDPQTAAAKVDAAPAVHALPDWALRRAPADPGVLKYASPSQLAEHAGGPAPSPLEQADGLGRFRRGDIIHRLLQLLPDVAPDSRRAAAKRLLSREPGLTDEQRGEMAAAAFGVLEDPQFAEVFAPGSRAEAAIAGTAKDLPDGLAVSGRVDRLLVTPERVLVVDYKTNRPAPASIEAADEAYRVQMAVYAAVLREVFPGRKVAAALVWTDGPKLMAVPEKVMAEALARLA